jgi:nucleotide-binding universal stress UspA family protein
MPMSKQSRHKKLLLPIDGSDRSLGTVTYVAKMEPFHKMKAVLFHVFAGIPEYFWDLQREPKSIKVVPEIRAWQREEKKKLEAYMHKAEQILLQGGFSAQNVIVKIQKRKKGIARDIIREAQNGYDVVVARRRGAGALRGTVLGSIATKCLQGLSFIPLMLVGKRPAGNKILLAFDGSEGAMTAVNFTAATLGTYDFHLRLIHVFRAAKSSPPEKQRLYLPGEYAQAAKEEIATSLEKAKKILIEAGFNADRISTKIITGVSSRADAIVDEAKKEDYGTIILGRRGVTRVREFFIGRVTNKVIYLGRDRTVWVVR